jgi:hypothetical protein
MSSGYSRAITKDKYGREDFSQVAEILLEEFERIVYEVEWINAVHVEEMKREIFFMASVDLKNFIVRNIRGDKEWESIEKKITRENKRRGRYARKREKETRNMMNLISSTVRIALETKNKTLGQWFPTFLGSRPTFWILKSKMPSCPCKNKKMPPLLTQIYEMPKTKG